MELPGLEPRLRKQVGDVKWQTRLDTQNELCLIGRPSISMQLKSLESFIGAPLFKRRGRYLELTEMGKLVHGYAEDIFQSGRELVDAVRGGATGRPLTFHVGIADGMAKTGRVPAARARV